MNRMESVSTNPFRHRVQFTQFALFRIFIATFTIFPIRLVICFTIFVFACWIANINYALLRLINPKDETRHKLRKLLALPSIILLRIMLFFSGIYRIKTIDNTDEKQDSQIFLLVPHTSYFDLYPALFLSGSPSWISRTELKNFPFIQNLLKLTGFIFIDQTTHKGRLESAEQIKSITKKQRIVICPEATYTNGSALLQFDTGAFAPGLPVTPIIIKYNNWDGIDTTTLCSDGFPFFQSLFLSLCSTGITITVTKLKPYSPNNVEKTDPKLFSSNVRNYISKQINIPLSHYIYEDLFYFKIARKLEAPTTPPCIKLIKLCHKASEDRQIFYESGTQLREKNYSKVNKVISTYEENQIYDHLRNRRPSIRKNSVIITSEYSSVSVIEMLLSKGLNAIESVDKNSIQSSDHILSLFSFKSITSSIESSLCQELVESINCSGLSLADGLIITLLLCNSKRIGLWERLNDCVKFLRKDNVNLTSDQFKALTWFFLGLNKDQISDYEFESRKVCNSEITFNYMKVFMKNFFKRAFQDQVPSLIDTLPVN